MANTILITANWHTGALSQQTISRQYDNNRYAVRFVGYPEASDDNELDYYLLVWMSSAPGEAPDEITPIQLASDQWYISNVFTQQTQQIKFQMCALNTEGTFEAHSPIFTGFVRNSLDHDGTTQDIDVSTLFDAYREYLNELIIRSGAVVIDSVPTQGSTNAVQSGGVKSALDTLQAQIPPIDPTLTQSGKAADAKVTGDRIEGAESRIVDVYGRTIPRIIEWIDGEYIKREDGTVDTLASYHRTDYIEVVPNSFINFTCSGNYDVKYNAWYDSSKAFVSAFSTAQNASRDILVPANARYMRLSFNKTSTNTITISHEESVLKLLDNLCEKNNLYLLPFNNTIYYFGQGIFGYTPTRIGTVIPVTAKTKLKISVDSGYKYSLNKFSSVIPSTSTEISSTGWITTDSVVNEGEIFLVNVAKTDDANLSPEDGQHLKIYNEEYSEKDFEVVVHSK